MDKKIGNLKYKMKNEKNEFKVLRENFQSIISKVQCRHNFFFVAAFCDFIKVSILIIY